MGNISENIRSLKSSIPENLTLVAVSKTKPLEDILEAYNSGHLIFGENRVQEIVEKQPLLPGDIELHMIGHLQTNKVKHIIDKVHMIEGVDSLKLLNIINREAVRKNLIVKILLQFHIADEETKYGFSLEEICDLLDTMNSESLTGVEICGVMGMATFTEDIDKLRSEFKRLKYIFDRLKTEYFSTNSIFKEISMGMSGDFRIAIEEGSTMIRVGSAIFGLRNKKI